MSTAQTTKLQRLRAFRSLIADFHRRAFGLRDDLTGDRRLVLDAARAPLEEVERAVLSELRESRIQQQ